MNEEQREVSAKHEKQNSLINKFKRHAEKGVEKLRDNLQGKLRSLTLEELAEVTQALGTQISRVYLSVTAIAVNLIRRMEKEGPFTGKAKAGSIVKTITITPTMTVEEVEEAIEELKHFIDESDAPEESKSLAFLKLDSKVQKNSEFSNLTDELQKFDQELKRLKGK